MSEVIDLTFAYIFVSRHNSSYPFWVELNHLSDWKNPYLIQ